jgi:hypothetical protein
MNSNEEGIPHGRANDFKKNSKCELGIVMYGRAELDDRRFSVFHYFPKLQNGRD